MIRKAEQRESLQAAALAGQLWPGHSSSELETEFEALTVSPDAAVFLAWENGSAVGFAQCQLRRDYVEGTSTSPVGYLEGVFVQEGFRRRGLAGELLAACEAWARAMGCREFASDCELNNTESLAFHQKAGFAEANRIICFTKPL